MMSEFFFFVIASGVGTTIAFFGIAAGVALVEKLESRSRKIKT